ncbi:Uncharacterised protein [Mycobacterium tuberculosis]|nr:Uncharacterised protein [Mycobacterium tuberculosis]CKR73091.1 Uncharacterised protein [Mycobacterium tuberculosis]CKT00578.1 Uncharacterised protein [Mycobacterium tuberculosis]
MAGSVGDIAVPAKRMAPAGARYPVPPLPPVTQVDRPGRRTKHHRTGTQVCCVHSWVEPGVKGLFCNRHIACRGDEFGKLRVGHRVSLYRKGAHGHGMNRRFFGVEARRAHAERSAGQVNQLGQHDFSVCRPRRPASQQTAQSREKASARSDSTSSNGRPDTSTVTWVMVPPVNANGAS